MCISHDAESRKESSMNEKKVEDLREAVAKVKELLNDIWPVVPYAYRPMMSCMLIDVESLEDKSGRLAKAF